jgi:hypothetical protein
MTWAAQSIAPASSGQQVALGRAPTGSLDLARLDVDANDVAWRDEAGHVGGDGAGAAAAVEDAHARPQMRPEEAEIPGGRAQRHHLDGALAIVMGIGLGRRAALGVLGGIINRRHQHLSTECERRGGAVARATRPPIYHPQSWIVNGEVTVGPGGNNWGCNDMLGLLRE